MTHIYFVRHAQPVHSHNEDRTRPLSAEGRLDRERVRECLTDVRIDRFYSSPYLRSVDTIRPLADARGMSITTDERFRERRCGLEGNRNSNMFRRRWADFTFCEEGGEALDSVTERNWAALTELLAHHPNESIVVGTHGTALSTILHRINPGFGCDGFLRMIDFMPYVIRLDFDGTLYQSQEELLIVKKVFSG